MHQIYYLTDSIDRSSIQVEEKLHTKTFYYNKKLFINLLKYSFRFEFSIQIYEIYLVHIKNYKNLVVFSKKY